MNLKKQLPMVGTVLWLLMGCGDDAADSEGENTADRCKDDVDNDGDGATDCADAECMVICKEAEVDTEPTGPIDADVSGMPIPPLEDAPRPEGDAGNLAVLNWAGFKAAVSYTFDDTQPSQIEHYDELQATNVKMTFFANSSRGGSESFDAAWTRAVDDGHEIGNHTANHCYANLEDCPNDSLETEIEECSAYITEHFGQENIWTMASPYGDGGWSAPAKDYFFLNRSVSPGTIAVNDSSNPFNLPSIAVAGGETAADLNEDIDGVYDDGEWLIYCIHSILPTANNWYAGIDIESIAGNIDHVKSKGDMWADTMANVGAYWMGQKVLQDVSPQEQDGSTVWTWTLPPHFPAGKYVRVTVDGGTLSQRGRELTWSGHGYYEVSLDKGELTLTP